MESVNQKSNRMTFFFVVMFLFNMAANFVHPVTPAIIMDLELNDYMFGLAYATMMAFNFLFSPFWGKIIGQVSSKTVMLIGGLGYVLGQVFFGLAQTQIQFLLARMVAGMFCGGSFVAFLTYTVNMSSEELRGRNLTINATLQAISAAFGYFVGGMVGEINVYYAVWLQAAVLALASILHFFGCRDDRSDNAEKLSGHQLMRVCNPFSAIAQCRYFMTRLLAFLFLGYGLANLGYIAFEQCFNYYLRDQFGLSSGYNGIIKAALGVISMIANSTLCMWIIRRRRVSPYLVAVMSICTLAMIGVIATGEMLPFIVINVIFFAFYFISTPLEQNLAAELGKGESSNLVMGAFNAVKSFGSIFGAALAGFIYEVHAKLPFIFGFAAFAAATFMMILLYREEKRQGV